MYSEVFLVQPFFTTQTMEGIGVIDSFVFLTLLPDSSTHSKRNWPLLEEFRYWRCKFMRDQIWSLANSINEERTKAGSIFPLFLKKKKMD